MGTLALRNDEKIGLGAAVVLHAALVGVLAMQTMRQEVTVFPERISVSLATEVGLQDTAPEPVSESRASIAPTLADNPAPAPEAAKPDPAPRADPAPPPRPVPKPVPKPVAKQQVPAPAPAPAPARDRSRPDRSAPAQAATTPPRQTAAPKPSGGSRIGDDFLAGKGSSSTTTETRAPAQTIGAAELASLRSAVGRQVKIKWQGRVPQGPDAELLVTRVRFRLNPDGTLAGEPELVGATTGVTDLNRNQVARHREEAVRAIKLVGQFNVPFPVPADKNTFTLVFDRNS
ncbi:MAG: energy transducer TonB [Porphyrobacter sp.]|nr:energy transducer TonB [Porphyrobacter sp.]